MSAGISDQRMKGQGNQGMFGPSFGQQSSYNYFPNNEENYNKNSWNSQQVNGAGRRGYDDGYYRGNDKQRAYGNDGIKSIEHGIQGMGLDGGNQRDSYSASAKTNNQSNTSSSATTKETSSAPKKMTWASIASQPAKPQARASSTASTLKKKGPGMPPPPMVPGKHNMDIGTWESEKNGSALVPPVPVPSPPPVIDEPSPFSQPHASKSNHNANNVNSNNNSNPNNSNPNNDSSQGNVGSASGMNQHHGRNEAPQYERGHYNNRDREYREREPREQREYQPREPRDQRDQRDGYMQRQNWNQNRGNGYHNNSGAGGHYQRSNYGPNQDRQDRHMNYHQNDNRNSHYQQQSGDRQSYGPPQHRPMYRSSPPSSNQQSFNNAPNRGNHEPASGSAQESPQENVETEPDAEKPPPDEPVVERLLDKNNYNPTEFDMEKLDTARFFVIKSYSEDDIHRSIKYEIWCSTEHGNKRLDQAFRETEREDGNIYLLFSVNGSGHFCGVAQMMTAVDYNSVSSVWHQDKWKGKFSLKWIYVKDVPNPQLRHIRLENNENKPVTNSRDTQEVPNAEGRQVLEIIHAFKHTTSIFDDFIHYEQRQVEDTREPRDPNQYEGGEERGAGGGGHRPMQPHAGGNRNYQNRNDAGQYHRNEGGYNENRGRNNYGQGQGHYQQGGRPGGGYQNNYERRNDGRNDGEYQPRNNYNRDYNNRREGGGGGFMSRDRGEPRNDDFNRENNRYDRDRMDRNEEHHSGGFKRNNFGNRSNHSSGGYRN